MTKTNSTNISNNQIIIFLVFICAAIMTSLFIYHSSQKPAPSKLPEEIGLIFAAPRDIKSFQLETINQQKFTEKNLYQHWTLLFFGFTHCANVCPATLDMVNRAYKELHAQYPNLQVALISVDPERDTPEVVSKYAQSFNPNFIGVSGKIQELRKLQSQLGVYAARDNETLSKNNEYQIQHTSSLMLINPQGKWAGFFRFGLKPDELIKGIKMGITS